MFPKYWDAGNVGPENINYYSDRHGRKKANSKLWDGMPSAVLNVASGSGPDVWTPCKNGIQKVPSDSDAEVRFCFSLR